MVCNKPILINVRSVLIVISSKIIEMLLSQLLSWIQHPNEGVLIFKAPLPVLSTLLKERYKEPR